MKANWLFPQIVLAAAAGLLLVGAAVLGQGERPAAAPPSVRSHPPMRPLPAATDGGSPDGLVPGYALGHAVSPAPQTQVEGNSRAGAVTHHAWLPGRQFAT